MPSGFKSLLVLTLIVASGCASLPSGVAEGENGVADVPVAAPRPAIGPDAEALAALSDFPDGGEIPLQDGGRVRAGVPYVAASGKLCRSVAITRPATRSARRLACVEGGQWRWVPSVITDRLE